MPVRSVAGTVTGGVTAPDRVTLTVQVDPPDAARDARWFHEGACLSRFTSGLDGLLMSRPFLEGMVRKRLLALPNIRARENCHVEGLAATADKSRITGVKTAGEVLSADLVVDASGRGSQNVPQRFRKHVAGDVACPGFNRTAT